MRQYWCIVMSGGYVAQRKLMSIVVSERCFFRENTLNGPTLRRFALCGLVRKKCAGKGIRPPKPVISERPLDQNNNF